jgi:uncharacterized repeat protein (TIGR01451 family)
MSAINRRYPRLAALLSALLLLSNASQVLASGETVTSPALTLPAGKTVTVRFNATVDNPQPAGNLQIDNTGSIAGTNFGTATTNTTSRTADAAPNLGVTVTDGGASVAPGGTITYTITYANAGNQSVTGVTLTNPVPANTTFAGGTPGWACAVNCVLSVGAVAGNGGGGVATIQFTVNAVVPIGVTQIDEQVVIADDGTSAADPNLGDNVGTDFTPIHRPTTTTLISSLNPSVFGQSVTFTATVVPTTGVGTPTGTVTFFDNGVALGAPVALAGGSAGFTTSTLAAGSHPITATYNGDPNFDGSTSALLTQVVAKASTTTALISSLNPSIFGQSVTFTATVTVVAPGTGIPTGSVNFLDGATVIGTGAVNASGVATFSTTALTVGTHSITAVYAGDVGFNTSTSAPVSQLVKNATTTVLTSSANPQRPGYNVTFTATVTGTSAVPTGNVTFRDGATVLATVSLNASGVATLTVNNLALGVHPITADYPETANFGPSTSAVLNQVIANNPPSRPGVVSLGTGPGGFNVVYLRGSLSTGNGDLSAVYGVAGDQTLAGDWTDKGFDTLGLARGTTFIESDTHAANVDRSFVVTPPGTVAVKGDWDGNGTDTPGTFTNGIWNLRNSNTAGASDVIFAFGAAGDIPVVGDWDGDGADGVGVYRNGTWYLRNSVSAGAADYQFGYSLRTDEIPVVGDWDGNGTDTPGLFWSGTWHLRNRNSGGAPQIEFNLGNPGDLPIVGAWGPIGQPEVDAGDLVIKEGNAGSSTGTVTISLSNVSLGTVTVTYATQAVTATAGTDYQSVAGTLTFLPGETSKDVTVTVFGDTVPEPDEKFNIVLSGVVGATLPATSSGTVTIADDESPVTRYRLYFDLTKEHLYTTDLNEYLVLGTLGWDQEGPAHQVLTSATPFMGQTPIPFYRLYHPTIHQHLWTTDALEYGALPGSGWIQEGTECYILAVPIPGVTVPLYRLVYPPLQLHLWTTDAFEYSVLPSLGWTQEGIVGHVIPIP